MREHPDAARIAHLLRRCTFGPSPGEIESAIDEGYDAVLDRLLADDRRSLPTADANVPATYTEWADVVRESWKVLLLDPRRGLHAKMTWFWSTHFTTSPKKVHPALIWQQLVLINRHALGNFRELTERVNLDPAMLVFLDGDKSRADDPNENHARELMELFTLGHGAAYTEEDVRAGARALAGWVVDREELYRRQEAGIRISLADPITASVDPERANTSPVEFLGEQVLDAEDVITTVLDHPDCAPFIVGEIHEFFVGTEPSDADRADLASSFVASGMEIRPLVDRIIRSQAFVDSEYARPRSPAEWYPAAVRAATDGPVDPNSEDVNLNPMKSLGQEPSSPPNVSGWPAGAPWLSASQQILKTKFSQWMGIRDLETPEDPVKGVLERCSIVTVSPTAPLMR